jgi:hypothetical protein
LTRGRPNDPLRVSEAHGQWRAQTAELKTALTSLQAAVKNLTGSPSAAAVGGVVTAPGPTGAAMMSRWGMDS